MVTNSHINSEFKDIAIIDVNGNVIGANVEQLTVSNISNLHIPGGLSTQVLITADGAGNLDWETVGISGIPETAIQGNSNIVVMPNGNITLSATGVANVMTVSNTAVTLAVAANLGNISNLVVTGSPGVNHVVVGNQAGTTLSFEQELLIPETGFSYGRLIARGKRIYRAGNSGDNNRVLGWWNYGEGYDVARQMPLNNGTAPELKYFTKIHTNMSCIYALGDNGVFYVSGYDNNGQLGTGPANGSVGSITAQQHPTLYGAGITVVDFWSYSAYRSDSNGLGACMVTVNDNGTFKTYMFGYNVDGVLGNGTATTPNHVPTIISQFTGRRPISVSFIEWTCMVVLNDGTVWGCGWNSNGQLGNATSTHQSTFVQAKDSTNAFITGAAQVATSYASGFGGVSFVRKTDGTLWGAGWGADNRMSQGPDVTSKTVFTQVKTGASTFMSGIVDVVSSYADTMALDSSGQVWGWSGNWNGMWGNGDPENTTTQYAKVIQTGVSKLWLPNSIYNTRCMFITKNNKTYAAGLNINYQIGTLNISGTVLNISRVVFPEPDEYAIDIVRIGKRSETAETWFTGHMYKTNKNRVYISGRFSSYIGAFAGIDLGSQPIEITDII